MANLIKNIIIFEGEKECITHLLESVKSDQSAFDFNKLIPMPESLFITDSTDEHRDKAILYYLARIDYKEAKKAFEIIEKNKIYSDNTILPKFNEMSQEELIKETALWNSDVSKKEKEYGIYNYFQLGATYVNNIKKYGFPTWCQWRHNYWGTKKNAKDVFVERKEEGKAIVTFNTVWKHPYPIVKFIATRYPKIKITHNYADEELGYNCGKGIFLNKKTKFEIPEDAFIFACNVWGYDDEEEDVI